MSVEERLRKMEQGYAKMFHTVMGWDVYLKNIQSNQKFYLQKRMPLRDKREAAYHASIRRLEGLSSLLESLDVSLKKGYGKLSLFLCTPNQAKKLRRFADEDLRVEHAWKEIKHGEKQK